MTDEGTLLPLNEGLIRTPFTRTVAVDDATIMMRHPDVGNSSGASFEDDFVLPNKFSEMLADIKAESKRESINNAWGLEIMKQDYNALEWDSPVCECEKSSMFTRKPAEPIFRCCECNAVLCIPCFIQEMFGKLKEKPEDGTMEFVGCPYCKGVFQNLGDKYIPHRPRNV